MPKGKMESAIAECDMKRTAIIELLKLAIEDGSAKIPQDVQDELNELETLEKEKDQIIIEVLAQADRDMETLKVAEWKRTGRIEL